MQGRKSFEEKLFTHFQLSDRVPPDNFYRKLKEILDLRFLYKTTAPYYGTEGQESTLLFGIIPNQDEMDFKILYLSFTNCKCQQPALAGLILILKIIIILPTPRFS